MSADGTPWPHAPLHQLSTRGTYFVTARTLHHAHYFRGKERLAVLHRGLLKVAAEFGWRLEAWAAFSNHYHFIGHSPESEDDARSLSRMLGLLHEKTAKWVNRLDKTPGRQVWFNFRETKLTYERSYLARLNYTHQNAVKHRLVPVANRYPWCSARWFERTARPAQVNTIYRLKTDRLNVADVLRCRTRVVTFGLRWQAQRDTAFSARASELPSRPGHPKSAVVAALCRRSPKKASAT